MRFRTYFLILLSVISACIFGDVQAKPEHRKSVDDPFELQPAGVQPNCDREQRFKYEITLRSIDDFIALLKAHQSDQGLHGFVPTKENLVPGYTLQSVGMENKRRISLDDLKANVAVVDVKRSTLGNKKIYILQISHQDYKEGWPWQVLITASDQGNVSVVFCAGI
jgi:hypothetical protein